MKAPATRRQTGYEVRGTDPDPQDGGMVGAGAEETLADVRGAVPPISSGLENLPGVARRLQHSRELGEPLDFLSRFEFAPEDGEASDEIRDRLWNTRR